MSSYQYRKSHCGDKTVVRSSYLHNGTSYTCKMQSLYWIRAQITKWFHAIYGISQIIITLFLTIVNSSPSSAVYMNQRTGSALVQVMFCRLFGTKPLLESVLTYCTLRNKLQWKSNQNTKFWIDANVFDYAVCKIAAILSRVGWLNRFM